ncbi:hypothetical protein PSACC_00511 [Paramicrosporidium saccamoebae]|uniref:Phytanoyl-CoA dioxygenase n=1 Tax=Paramicrosporidium saccamoebae TaxID=1246581 RepID=A0A2H9TPJ4_9FUNG|nr:hypothetical protein PSACC_00511 [Paramicrosporidium saccamoebae]
MKSLGRRFWTVAISGLAFLLVLAGTIHAYRNSREQSTPAVGSKEPAKTPEKPKCPFGYGDSDVKEPKPAGGKCPFGYDKKVSSANDDEIGSGASVKKPQGTVKIASRAAAHAINHHGFGGDAKQCPFLAKKENADLLREMQSYSYSSSSASSSDSCGRKSKRKHGHRRGHRHGRRHGHGRRHVRGRDRKNKHKSRGPRTLSTQSTQSTRTTRTARPTRIARTARKSQPKGRVYWSTPQDVKNPRRHNNHGRKKQPRSQSKKPTKSRNSKKRDQEQFFKSRGFDVDRIKKMGYKIPDKDHFNNDGYLLIKNFLSEEQIQQLRNRAQMLAEQLKPESHPVTRFVTKNSQQRHSQYFLASGDNISFFYEAGALNDKGELVVPKERALNKIGHVFRNFTHSSSLIEIFRQLGFEHPNPRIGGEVVPHQDSTFLYTEPNSAIGFWFALDDCTAKNGTLSFIPGSHKVRNDAGTETCFQGSQHTFEDKRFVQLEIPKGTLVLIHGSVVHQSGPNLSEDPRNAYTFHVIEGNCQYDNQNWLQPPERGFDRVY